MQEPDYERDATARQLPEQRRDQWLWLKIIVSIWVAGVLIFGTLMCSGIVILGATAQAVQDHQAKQTAELSRVMTTANGSIEMSLERLQANNLRQAEIARHANDPLPVPDGYRCVGKQLFRELPNGFEQVTGVDNSRYCR